MLKIISNLNKPRFINIQNQICKNNYNTNLFNSNSSLLIINKLKFTTTPTTTPATTTTNFQISLDGSFNKYENINSNSNNDNNNETEKVEKRKELIRLVSENPNCSKTILNLWNDMNNQETITNPFYIDENRGNRAPISEFSKLDLILLVLSIDETNKEALEFICSYLLEEDYHGIYLYDKLFYHDKYLSIRNAAEILYKTCNGNTTNSILYFLLSLNGCDTYEMEDGTIIKVIDLILEGVKKHKKEYPFHAMLAHYMSKNHYYKLPTNDDGKEMNRIELLKISIELHKSDNPFFLAMLFHELGDFLENKVDTIKLFGDQVFTKHTAFSKGIELSEGYFGVQVMLVNKLVKYMNVNDRVLINNIPFSRIDLLKRYENVDHTIQDKYYLIESFEQLSKFYKLDGNFQESNHFQRLVDIETQIYKEYLIKSIETKQTSPVCHDFSKYSHLLASKILKDGEIVTFSSGTKMDKLNLSKYASMYDSKVKNYNCIYSRLMLEDLSYSPDEDCHTALLKEFNASPSNPKAFQLLVDIVKIYESYDLTPNSPDSYLQLINILYKEEINGDHFEIIELIPSKSEILSKIYSKLIALEPETPENYLQLGIHLKESLVNSISITYPVCPTDKYFTIKDGGYTLSQYSRKELFSKYLQLKYNTESINGILNSEPLAWYLLSMEMNDGEILFGKSRKQILINIIENIDSSFSLAYSGLSELIEIDDDSEKVQLLLKAIQIESDLIIKSVHLNKLASILIDNDQKVELIDDGRKLNKQQLLIESIEIYPRKNHSSSLKLLVNTLEKSNDTVSLFAQNYNKSELLELLLVHLKSDESKIDFLETFKIKSNIILNKINKYF